MTGLPTDWNHAPIDSRIMDLVNRANAAPDPRAYMGRELLGLPQDGSQDPTGWQGTSTDQTAQHLEGGTTYRLRVKIERNSRSVNQEFTAEVEGNKLIADMESDLHNALDACATQASRMVAYMKETEEPS